MVKTNVESNSSCLTLSLQQSHLYEQSTILDYILHLHFTFKLPFYIENSTFKGFLMNKDIKIIYFELEDPSLSYP